MVFVIVLSVDVYIATVSISDFMKSDSDKVRP